MAPSSERPYETNPAETPSERKENPFIKFRQFADAQIGSLLQGIIGLPSAFSGNTPGSQRWTDFDDDLRRRDELQARQNLLKEQEAKRLAEQQVAIPQRRTEIPYPKTPSNTESAPQLYIPSQESEGKDIPLYSPTYKELFANLGLDISNDWHKQSNAHSLSVFRGPRKPFLLEGQNPTSDLQRVQFMAYNELNRGIVLRSEYSLLPYLLFSPYSPIRLQIESRHTVNRVSPGIFQIQGDTFPYRAAFDDLIRTAHGDVHFGRIRTGFFPNPGSGNIENGWMQWIRSLYLRNVLQERATHDINPNFYPFAKENPHYTLAERLHQLDGSTHDVKDDNERNLQTEQDMYDRFLSQANFPSLAGALYSLSSNPEAFIQRQFKALDSPEGKEVIEELMGTKFAKDLMMMMGSFEQSKLSEPKAESTYDESQANKSTSPTSVPYPPLQQNSQSTTDNLFDQQSQTSGRIVSTSTTTEHTTHEDGSVETCVTVWKRYADGRESTTTTNHFNNPPCDENGNPVTSQESEDASIPDSGKKQDKKGWFWN